VTVHYGDEFIVVDVAKASANMDFTEKSKMTKQLAQTHVGGQLPNL
jgi:hypothetical protein